MKKNSLLVIILSVIVFVSFGCKKPSVEKDMQLHDSSQPMVYMEYKTTRIGGGEMGPIVSTAYFTGQIREAYATAAEIPEVLDHLYCYCYCAEDHGHRSLRTCFYRWSRFRMRYMHVRGYTCKRA